MLASGLGLGRHGDLSEWSAWSSNQHFRTSAAPQNSQHTLPYIPEDLIRCTRKPVPHGVFQISGLEKEPQGNVREDDCIGGPDLDGMIKEGLREVLSQPRPIL